MGVTVTDMTNDEALDDICMSLATAICNEEYDEHQERVRKLLREFADEIKRSAIEP